MQAQKQKAHQAVPVRARAERKTDILLVQRSKASRLRMRASVTQEQRTFGKQKIRSDRRREEISNVFSQSAINHRIHARDLNINARGTLTTHQMLFQVETRNQISSHPFTISLLVKAGKGTEWPVQGIYSPPTSMLIFHPQPNARNSTSFHSCTVPLKHGTTSSWSNLNQSTTSVGHRR
jgi:hypothetical protein